MLSDCLYLSLAMTQLLQLKDVVRGLIYMHDQGIIHGDLKGVCFRIPPTPSRAWLTRL